MGIVAVIFCVVSGVLGTEEDLDWASLVNFKCARYLVVPVEQQNMR